jgi:hypothetical protein
MSERQPYSMVEGQEKALREWLAKYDLPFDMAYDRKPFFPREKYPCLRLRGLPTTQVVAHFHVRKVRGYSFLYGKGNYIALPDSKEGILDALRRAGISAHELAAAYALKS